MEVYSYIQLDTPPGKLAVYNKEEEEAFLALTKKGATMEVELERSLHYFNKTKEQPDE